MTSPNVPFLVSGISYIILLLFESLASIWKARRGSVVNIHKLFHTILTMAIIGRITYFMFRAFNHWATPGRGYELLLPDLTSVGFYLTFLVLVFLWARVSYRARQRFRKLPEKPKVHQIIMVTFWFVVIFSLTFVTVANIITSVVPTLHNTYNLIVQTCFFPILSFTTGFGFVMFGIFLCSELSGHRREIHKQILRNQLIKIGFLGLVGTISFVVRACIVIIVNVLIQDLSKHLDTGLFEMVFYLSLEWLPSLIVVIALNTLQWSPHQQRDKSKTPLLSNSSGYLSSYSSGYLAKTMTINSPSSDGYDNFNTKESIQSGVPAEPEFVLSDPGDMAFYSGSLSTEDNYMSRDANELVLDSSTDSSDNDDTQYF